MGRQSSKINRINLIYVKYLIFIRKIVHDSTEFSLIRIFLQNNKCFIYYFRIKFITDVALSVLKKQVTNLDSKYKAMLVWDHDNARDIAWLTVEKDIKVDPDALQFRDTNLPLQVLEEEGQEVIVIDESRDRSSENWLKRNGQQEALTKE